MAPDREQLMAIGHAAARIVSACEQLLNDQLVEHEAALATSNGAAREAAEVREDQLNGTERIWDERLMEQLAD